MPWSPICKSNNLQDSSSKALSGSSFTFHLLNIMQVMVSSVFYVLSSRSVICVFLHGLKPSTGYNANCHKHQNFCNDIRIRGERKDASFSHSVLWNLPFKNSIFVFPHYVSHSPQGLGGEWSVAYLSTTVYILFLILGGCATSTSSCWTPQWRMGWRARWFLCSKNWVQVGCCRT